MDESPSIEELRYSDLKRLLALKKYFLSTSDSEEDNKRLTGEIELIETRLLLVKAEEDIHSEEEEGIHYDDENEEDYYEEDDFKGETSFPPLNTYTPVFFAITNRLKGFDLRVFGTRR